MIELQKLSKTYGTKAAPLCVLKNIDLTVADGESVAIMGKSGAGKTTLLNIIGCLDSFEEGDCMINRQNIKKMKDSSLAKLRNSTIGFVLQDFALVAHKTVLFNVMLPMYFDRTPRGKMKQEALHALEKVGIANLANKKVNTLSGGEKQRTAIARAIVKQPTLLLADEPTGSLDSNTGESIMGILSEMNQLGITLIVVTHDETVAGYCNRKIVLHDGCIISDVREEQETSREILSQGM